MLGVGVTDMVLAQRGARERHNRDVRGVLQAADLRQAVCNYREGVDLFRRRRRRRAEGHPHRTTSTSVILIDLFSDLETDLVNDFN